MAPDRLHILILPFPIQGHINPMLHFASHLASRGCFVTFLCNQLSHKRILAAHRPSHRHQSQLNLDIRLVATPDELPPSFEISQETLPQIMDDLQKLQGGVEELIESSRIGTNPITCIISNCLCPWAQDLAKKAGLPGLMFWTSNATTLYLGHLRNSGQLTNEDLECDHLDLGSLHVDLPQVFSNIFAAKHPETSNRIATAVHETEAKASHILMNSFEALEAFLEPTGPMATKMRYIGPCLPMELLESQPSNEDNSMQAESLFTEDVECLKWLDSHAACSVLFMSFGSISSFPADQIEQIARGIEESKLKFLWVVRPAATGKSPVPEGFVDRTKDQGRIIPWAQQLQVLQHPAIGGFMTHCGWNSTLESIFMGVPMLCLPLFAEQPINAYLITKQWRVGMALEKDGDGNVRKEEVERAARRLMEGDEGRALRKRAGEMKEASRQALREGGSSFEGLQKLLAGLENTKC